METSREYKDTLEKLAFERTNLRVPNFTRENGSIVIETMFKHAQTDIRIYSDDLDPAVFDNYRTVENATRFLETKLGARIRILLQKPLALDYIKNRPLVQQARDNKSVQVRFAVGSYATDEARKFVTMDECGFRFEAEKDKYMVNFNEPSVTKELVEAFDQAFHMATPVVLD